MDRACTHCEGNNGELGEVDTAFQGKTAMHRFDRESEVDRWRWICSCGSKGHWQYQSPNVAYHSWLNHVVKDG